jgi:hypothetical protein
VKVAMNGTAAETVTQTSGEAARRMKLILKDAADDKTDDDKTDDKKTVAGKPSKKKNDE